MRVNQNRYMRHRLIVAFVFGTVFFGVLPVFAPPVVLQSDEIPGFLLGLGASVVAGAVLFLVAGGSIGRGLVVVAVAVLVGAVLYTFVYAFPTYGLSEEPIWVWPYLIWGAVIYLGTPAAIGVALAGAASALVGRLRRRGGER